jgi:hypothetical protein
MTLVASVEMGGRSVSGGSPGYDFHFMINVPIAQDLAFRLVAHDNYYPGYIDDPSRGVTNINGTHVTGDRAAFPPTDQFSIRLTGRSLKPVRNAMAEIGSSPPRSSRHFADAPLNRRSGRA